MSDYTGKKPSSADRVSDRLREATERIDTLERALLEAQDNLDRKLAEARAPYAHKIMALEQQIEAMREKIQRMEADKEVLFQQVEHVTAQLHTARSERAIYQNKLRRIHHDTMGA